MKSLRPSRTISRLLMARGPVLLATSASMVLVAACGGHVDSSVPVASAKALTCDDSMKTAFKPDANTTVTLVRSFSKGADINLNGTPSGVKAPNDLCVVKLNVGPGNPGPASAPSTSAGIGIEIWMPSPANWNNRIHVLGGGGFVGDPTISSLTQVSGITPIGTAAPVQVAGMEGAVSAVTDTGHVGSALDGAFAMNPDGSINTTLWTDFASRGIHEMAVETKALAAAYYAKSAKYSYWDGCSTGGRQGNEEAQTNPSDFDGILAGDAAINWTSFITSELYPQIVMQRDLGAVPLTGAQLDGVSAAAVSACDTTLTGQHDGFISDPASCKYDPTQDKAVLCPSSGGANTTSACVSTAQAEAINKMWYGQTVDGSVPSPSQGNGYTSQLQTNQLWFGITRGTQMSTLSALGVPGLAGSTNGTPVPFAIATSQIALELQNSALATPDFINATSNGKNGWMSLSYAEMAHASAQGVALQSMFGNIDTDNPDLTGFKARNGKLLAYHGMADQLITIQGMTNYYEKVAAGMGGIPTIQSFYRYFQIPGMGHCSGAGSVNGVAGTSPAANPPLPAQGQLYSTLVNWVENDVPPDKIVVQNSDSSISRPLCMYPSKLTYNGGNTGSASSYTCS
ncbi:tannase/feruloyl esterase family alpha/beta hydrolase [Paraburkholderia sp.]|uniref:tannase/feruloyl esterase family alpha/beta hydrolase n=1 Tax=Paraburkholderia sp. TaxID=1926495 RepID=UPI003D6FB419